MSAQTAFFFFFQGVCGMCQSPLVSIRDTERDVSHFCSGHNLQPVWFLECMGILQAICALPDA